jgi:type VI secretion system protein ImpH
VSAWTLLQRQPGRYRFDAAVRVLQHAAGAADPAAVARYRSQPAPRHTQAEVLSVAGAPGVPRVTLGLIGLLGPSGTLPPLYGESAIAASRGRSTALHDFIDLLAHRLVAGFAAAGSKYRLHRSAEAAALAGRPDPVGRVLLALTGHATANMAERVAAGPDALRHYAGLFAMRPRSAERLAALVSDWLGRPVEVEQFAGTWLALPEDARTSLPVGGFGGAWNRLGVDAAVGVRSWDPQARIVLRLGPLDRGAFAALLPDQPGHARLVSLVRAFLGPETGFALNPVLAAGEVPPLPLGGGARLGWDGWLTSAQPRAKDAPDAAFEAG